MFPKVCAIEYAFHMLKCAEKKGFPGFKKFGKHHALYPLLEINSIHNTQY